jgi:hypothetical protein
MSRRQPAEAGNDPAPTPPATDSVVNRLMRCREVTHSWLSASAHLCANTQSIGAQTLLRAWHAGSTIETCESR